MVKFLRRDWSVLSKLGKKRKNKQKWRNPTGRHNKIREKIAGHPARVRIGYGTKKDSEEKIKVSNMKGLDGVESGKEITLSRIGKKKKMEIVKKTQEKGIKISNLNVKKFLKKNEKKNETRK